MKRTLFKLGRSFRVTSRTVEDGFVLEVKVPTWLREEGWDFELETVPAEDSGGEVTGTSIEAYDLTQGTQVDFADPAWGKRLAEAARLKHRRALDRGLDITVNGRRLEPMPLDLSQGGGIEPAAERLVLEGGGVTVLLLAGVSEPEPSDAGWYVFCNDRLVLGPDKSRVTVWRGAGRQARGGVPNYHDQYSRFRGYALFEAVDPSLLPWTTTKTGIDADSSVWRATRPHMERITRPVIDFLNQLDKERTAVEGDARRGQPGLLDEDEELQTELVSAAVEQAPRVTLGVLIANAGDRQEAREFQAPRVDLAKLPVPQAWIRYAAKADEVKTARRLMGGGTERDLPNGEVGRRAFEYYLLSEGE